MFKKFFKKEPHKILQQQANEMEFLGSPYGDDALRLEKDLSERLETVSVVKGAYLVMVHYAKDGNDRVSLLIESGIPKDDIISPLVTACSGFGSLDILFMEDISETARADIRQRCKKFYNPSNTQ